MSAIILLAAPAAHARPLGHGTSTSAPTIASDAAITAQQQAAAMAKQSQISLGRAMQAINAAQNAARQAVRADQWRARDWDHDHGDRHDRDHDRDDHHDGDRDRDDHHDRDHHHHHHKPPGPPKVVL